MEPVEQDKTALISDIEADALKEADALVKEAQARAGEKKKYADKQIASLLEDARNRAREQAETIRKKAIAGVELDVKRRLMRLRTRLVQDVLVQVEQRLAAMMHNGDYRSVLIDWIAEAAIGLGADAAEVNASSEERAMIDGQLLAEAARTAQAATGRPVTLTLSTSPPLESQGVMLTAADRRTAFNNQVKTRMMRKHRRIHALIHDALFADDRKE